MMIDLAFDRRLAPCDNIDIRIGESVNQISLTRVNSWTRRAKLPNGNDTVWLIKNNNWCQGIGEIFFSIDIFFQNAFSGENLPYSFEIPIVPNREIKEIAVFNNGNIQSDPTSQRRWRIAVWVQCALVELLIAVPTVIFALIFKESSLLITVLGILFGFALLVLVRRRVKVIIDLLNGTRHTRF